MSSLKQRIQGFRWLWQALAIYLFAAWIGFEVIQTLTEGLGLPAWFPALALVLFIAGLPIILVTAFVQHGVKAPARHDLTLLPLESDARPPTRGQAGAARTMFTWRNAIMGGALAFGLWGVIATAWLARERRAREPATGIEAGDVAAQPADASTREYLASVAVLPFQDLAGTRENDYFSEGITEEIISQLASVEGLKVISRTSVVALKDASLTMPQIADTLGVRHVLEGTVRRSGDRVRITVQLIEAETDAHLWAESYTREVVDLFEVQEEIAREVSNALVTTVAGLNPTGPRSRTAEAAAYDAFLTGNYWLHGRTLDGLQRAIAAFEEAIAIDPAYAPVYAGLAQALVLWVFYSGGSADAYRAEGRGLAMADRAIELDPDLAAGYYTRGFAANHLLRSADPIAADFTRALELQPNSADLHGWYGHFLLREGDIAESMVENEIAVELDPLAPGRRTGFALDALAARHHEVALREARRATALEPDLLVPKVYEALALLLLGRPEECASLDVSPRMVITAMCFHSVGRVDEASAAVQSVTARLELEAGAEPPAGTASLLADVATYYAWLGDAEASLDWTERAFEFSPRPLDWRWVRSELFDKVRDDPGFESRMQRLREDAWRSVREHRDSVLASF